MEQYRFIKLKSPFGRKESTMTRNDFVKMAKQHGMIGAPCSFEETLALITDETIKITLEGPIGMVGARAYWYDGNGNGGCISIPA
jgi:hypothetical protein